MRSFAGRIIHWWLLAVCWVTFAGFALSLTFSAIHTVSHHFSGNPPSGDHARGLKDRQWSWSGGETQ